IHYVKDADSDICEEIKLSYGTFNYKPIVDKSEKPKSGSEYSTIDKCIEMYAKAKFKINVTHTGYVLYEFEEAHNHMFVPKAYRNLTKKRKQMSHPEQIFVQQLGSTSIGATRAHHLYASTHDGYESVNATETEYRNHKRDLNAHIGEGDAQMLITKMNNRKLHADNFSFEYNMVFIPFTGIDNHRKCVTFGAGMLSNETTKSYKWLLTCFLKAFNKQPRLVITDQDPAMKNAIASVFNESTHRLCRTNSRDHPRGRSRPRRLDASNEGCLEDGNASVALGSHSYKDLKAAFLAYFMQQKKYVKDPVEIHNIKQKDGETIEDFMERFKVETGRMKRAPECMRISGFMHRVNNPELTKRLNEHVLKTMEELMITTIAFIRGETGAASKKKGHTSWRAHDQSKRQTSEKRRHRSFYKSMDEFYDCKVVITL
nr:protein FAR1-related sequence 5-like [Tanacetum cinerariifolium]